MLGCMPASKHLQINWSNSKISWFNCPQPYLFDPFLQSLRIIRDVLVLVLKLDHQLIKTMIRNAYQLTIWFTISPTALHVSEAFRTNQYRDFWLFLNQKSRHWTLKAQLFCFKPVKNDVTAFGLNHFSFLLFNQKTFSQKKKKTILPSTVERRKPNVSCFREQIFV